MTASRATRSLPLAAVDAIVIAGLVVAGSLAFGAAYGGQRWLIACAGGAAVGAVTALIAARLRWNPVVTGLAVFLGYLLFGAALAVPSTAIGGVVPSLESLRLLTVGVVTSWRQLLTVSVPVGTSGALMIPVYLAAVVAAAVGTCCALRTRRPLWALAGPVGMMVVAALFGATTPWLPVVSAGIVAIAGLIWASWRRGADGAAGLDVRRPISAVVVLAAALAAGFFLGPHVDVGERYALRETVEAPFDPQEFPSPLVGFRKYFKDEKDAELFTVSGLPDGARIRLAVMDDYNGVTYNASTASGPFVRVGEEIDDPANGVPATIDVTIKDYQGVYLPEAGHLTGLTFESGDEQGLRDGFRYSGGNAVAVVVPGLATGDEYRASVIVPPSTDGMDLSSIPVDHIQLPVPARIPDVVKTAAGKFTENATTTYDKVAAIRKALADQGFLSHGTEGEEVSASGHGLDRLTRLLGDKEMIGDQEQFAPAMALMLRSLGIPARVVMGFSPKAPTADGPTVVHGSDVTAWVEVPFQGVGWVPFDPTPDDQRAAQQPDPQPEVAPRAQVLQPPPPPQPPQDAKSADVNQGDTDNRQDNPDNTDESDSILGTILTVGLWVGIPLLLIGVPIGLILFSKARRRKRRRSAPVISDRISGGWDQIVDRAADLGFRPEQRLTRTETADEVDEHLGGATRVLARRADARVFGPENVDEAEAERFWADVDAALLGLNAGKSRWRRLRAAVSTVSLRHRHQSRRR